LGKEALKGGTYYLGEELLRPEGVNYSLLLFGGGFRIYWGL